MNVSSSGTLAYELDLRDETQYECNVAAVNRAGRGPASSPVTFITPPGEGKAGNDTK
jgi:hypothetical protein